MSPTVVGVEVIVEEGSCEYVGNNQSMQMAMRGEHDHRGRERERERRKKRTERLLVDQRLI